MKKLRIMIIAHFCDYAEESTNNRFNYIARKLAERGHTVELVTSSFSHRDKRQREPSEARDGYKITLVREPSYRKNISLKRLFVSHPVFAKNLGKYLTHCEQPDLIYCAVPSLGAANTASEYAKRHGVKFIIDIQDLWPEAFALALKGKLPLKLLSPLMRKADAVYASADAVFGVSDTFVRRAVGERDVYGAAVYLGTSLTEFDEYASDEGAYELPRTLDGKILIGYCGTLGTSYTPELAIKALDELKSEGYQGLPALVIMGDGPRLEELKALSERLTAEVVFTGRLPYRKMCSVLKRCDIALNVIKRGSAQSIINKHADYAASGLPVINTQQSEEYRGLIEKYGAGINLPPDCVESLKEAIKRLCEDAQLRRELGKGSRRAAEECFDRDSSYKTIFDYIENS